MSLLPRRSAKRRQGYIHSRRRLGIEPLETRALLSVADLTGWAGVGNATGPNSYGVISASSVGGTLDARRAGTGEAAAYFGDTSLAVTGGTLTATTSGGFGSTGTLTFDASTNDTSLVDPVFYFGFFDKDNPAQGAFGFSIGDQTTSSFRFRATAGTSQTSGTGTTLSNGTYTYDLDVNNTDSGAGQVRFRLVNSSSVTVVDVSVGIPGSGTPVADTFGFLQPLDTLDSDASFGMTLSSINYTGETQITIPAAPSGLSATAVSPSQINVMWTDNASNETGFAIDRATDSGFTNNLTTVSVGANVTSYSATGLAAGTTYYFRVRATNAAGASANSATASAATQSASGVADLSGWSGAGNTSSPNNYGTMSQTSAGGTFDDRRFGSGEAASYFGDSSLGVTGGTLTATTSGGFSSSGTLTFDASTNTNVADPVFMLGFFDKDNPSQGAFGLTIADQTSSSFRFRAIAGLTQTTGSGTVLGDGAYTYNVDVNNAASGANKVRVRLFSGSTAVVDVNVTIPGSGTPVADTFGFVQPLASSDGDNTFTMNVSGIRYTGETLTTGGPAAPSNLTATAVSTSQIDLAWTDNASDETGFTIERAANSTFTADLTTSTVGANITTFSATGLTSSTTYYFRVRATNASGASGDSNTASATTSVTTPAAPSGLTATALSTSQINLSWSDNSSNETGFSIDQATNSTFTAGFATSTVGANVTTFSATGLSANTTYYFRVRATNSAGSSADSNVASATTPAASTATRYLNPTSGNDTSGDGLTAATAWKTFEKAIASSPTNVNTTVLIANGNYTVNAFEQIDSDPAPARTDGFMLTFQPSTAGQVTFTGTSFSNFELLKWRDVHNVRFEGLNFNKASLNLVNVANIEFVNNTATGSSFRVWGGSNISVEDNTFGGYTTEISAIQFHHAGISTDPFFTSAEKSSRHFYHSNLTIRNNVIDMDHNNGDGIHVTTATGVLIDGNSIKDISQGAGHGDCIQLAEVDTSVISNNFMSDGRGIIAQHLRTGSTLLTPVIQGVMHDLTFVNNVHSWSGSDFSLRVEFAPNLKVVNNTFWATGTSQGNGLDIGVGTTDVVLVNNILSVLKVVSDTRFLARGNNLIGIYYNTSPYSSLFTGETIVGSSGYTGLFVDFSTGDMHLKSTATQAIDHGANNGDTVQGDADGNGVVDSTLQTVSDVPSTDFDGNSISGLKKDIGAFED